jgi:hypothetical protein
VGIPPDASPYGSQTVTGPGWPNVDEEQLAAAAASYEAFAARLTGVVIPQLQAQLMSLSDSWEGAGALAAVGEASRIISMHEANAAKAAAIAAKLHSMEATVVKAKGMANATAVETQRECEAIMALPISNTQELLQSRIRLGQSQNIAQVTANTTELANSLGVPPNIPVVGAPTGAQSNQEGKADPQQAMQMLSQLGAMAGQLPQQLGQLVGQAPQQLAQPLQQLMQPLQQMTSAFGGMGKSDAAGVGAMPFRAFSNHPAAGGSGSGSGSGMTRSASLPGAGGTPARTPLMAKLVGDQGTPAASVAPEGASAGSSAAGAAPVAAGAGAMGGMAPMMGQRGMSGGTAASLAVPAPLDHDLAEDDVDEDW